MFHPGWQQIGRESCAMEREKKMKGFKRENEINSGV